MDLDVSLLTLVLYISPGLVGLLVFEALTVTAQRETLDRVVWAFVLAFLAHVVVHVVSGLPVDPPDPSPAGSPTALIAAHVSPRLLGVTVVAALIALAAAPVHNRGWSFSLAQKLGITRKTGRLNVWHDIFGHYDGNWVHITFADGRRLVGWPRFWSDYGPHELFVAKATWYTPDANRPSGYRSRRVKGPGVYISDFGDVRSLELLD